MSVPMDWVHEYGPQAKRVLECGTRKWGEHSTHHRSLFPGAEEYIMCDFIDGEDVDVVSDVQNLNEFEDNSFDAFFSSSLFEHIEHPWLATQAIFRVLKPGGWCYTATHQTFPVHGYPNDYSRWTDSGLRALHQWAGFNVPEAAMSTPCIIQKPDSIAVWDHNAPAFISVSVFALKPRS
jgi:SAM-dependent methyltransferase